MEKQEMVELEGGMLFMPGTGRRSYCSVKAETMEEKAALFNCVNSPSDKLKDNINIPIMLRHVYAEDTEFTNAETGEVQSGVRMVLIDDKGKAYQSCSKGVFGAVSKLFALFGEPGTWDKPIKIVPKLMNVAANRSVVTFEIK